MTFSFLSIFSSPGNLPPSTRKARPGNWLKLAALPALTLMSACSDNEVGDVSLGMFTTKDIKIEKLTDPVVTGVTCHISHVEADLDFSDPSDMSIACRQTGEITQAMLTQIDKSKSGEVVFNSSKSILFKSLKIRRIWDPANQTLIYLSYSTKEVEGSHKHSMSTVPLWNTPAWSQPAVKQD